MKIKNPEQVPATAKSKELDRAILQALLLTDGSVIPARYQISFANTSMALITQFCNLIYGVYGYQISKIGKGAGTKQALYLAQLKSKAICSDLLSDIPSYRTAPFEDGKYPETSIPDKWLEFSNEETASVLRALFDADGGCSLRVSESKKKKCLEIERTLFLSCKHPVL